MQDRSNLLTKRRNCGFRVGVVSAKNLAVQKGFTTGLSAITQKMYVDAAIMPLSCCDITHRSGGQPVNPHPVFR